MSSLTDEFIRKWTEYFTHAGREEFEADLQRVIPAAFISRDQVFCPDFNSLDSKFDRAIDVAKGEPGETFYLSTNSPEGRCVVQISMHPHMARKLRDWLIENYPE